jgi:hypothetical protein
MKRWTPRQVPTTFCAKPESPNATSARRGTRWKSRPDPSTPRIFPTAKRCRKARGADFAPGGA